MGARRGAFRRRLRGRIPGWHVQGQLPRDRRRPSSSATPATLEGSAKVASVDVKDENLAGHLQSPDFFDAERYPEIRFTAKRLSLDGETVKVEGDLTIKGVTQPLDVTGTVTSAAHRPVRPRALRAQARDARRPHPVRRQLEQPAPERRSGSRERRHARRRARSSSRRPSPMKILAISGSLRARLAQHEAAPGSRRAGRRRRRVRDLGRAEGRPALRRGRRRRARRRWPSRDCARRSPRPTPFSSRRPSTTPRSPGS